MVLWILIGFTFASLLFAIFSKRKYFPIIGESVDKLTLIYFIIGILFFLIPLKYSLHQHVFRAYYIPSITMMILAYIQRRSDKVG